MAALSAGGAVGSAQAWCCSPVKRLGGTERQGGSGGTILNQYSAGYDLLGRSTSSVTTYSLAQQVVVNTAATFNAASERTQVAVTGTGSLTNNYQYDTLSRMNRIEQTGAAAAKLVTLAYNKVSQFTGISRYSDLTGTNLVAQSAYAYETSGATSLSHRLTTMTYTRNATALATYSWGWDAADRITNQTIASQGFTAETSSYLYNLRNELKSATHNFTPNESYDYDGTGNRLAYTTGANNELTNDGTYVYTHDNEGNRKTKIGAGLTATYTWDHRNRLAKVESTVSSTTTTVEYTYDMMDRRIERKLNSSATNRWGYDGEAIAVEFDGSNTLTHRYLHGPVIDQVFADEAVGVATRWTLTDHLGTVRDVVDNSGANVKHLQYDSFGKRITPVGGVEILYNFTGREYDVETELQYNRARWYDPKVGRWLSTDPIGFDAGDSNLYRYVQNKPTVLTDPSGLKPIAGEITLKANATSTAEKGKFTPKGEKERESTDAELKGRTPYYMQYDGPTEFKGKYTIELKADKSVDSSKSTITFTTVNYTNRTYQTREDAAVTKEDEKNLIKKGQSVYRDGVNAHIFSKLAIRDSDWKTLPITITEVKLKKDDSVESFKFKSDTWYGKRPVSIIDKGIVGAVNLETGKAEFTAKYQSASTGVIATYKVKGTIPTPHPWDGLGFEGLR